MNDIPNFGHSIKLQAHFKNNQPADKNDEIIQFRPKPDKKWTSTKTHHTTHHTVNTFVESFENQVKNELPQTTRCKDKKNLNRHELTALEDLQKREDIVIINADKGGAITVLDTEDYVKEANRQLSDANATRNCPQTLL